MHHLRFSFAKLSHRASIPTPFCSGTFNTLARHLLESNATGPPLKKVKGRLELKSVG